MLVWGDVNAPTGRLTAPAATPLAAGPTSSGHSASGHTPRGGAQPEAPAGALLGSGPPVVASVARLFAPFRSFLAPKVALKPCASPLRQPNPRRRPQWLRSPTARGSVRSRCGRFQPTARGSVRSRCEPARGVVHIRKPVAAAGGGGVYVREPIAARGLHTQNPVK